MIKVILGAGLSYIIILLVPLMDKVDLMSLILPERTINSPKICEGKTPLS